MNRRWLSFVWVAPLFGAWAVGCSDDDVAVVATPDAGTPDAGDAKDAATPDVDAGDAGEEDAATPDTCAPPSGLSPRILVTAGGELAVFDLAKKEVVGRLDFPGFGATASSGANPYLLESSADVVAKLDAKEPWKVLSTWNVLGDDTFDGASSFANPSDIVVPTCESGYVVRYNRNKIAVIDTTTAADGGAPSSFVDLSAFVQEGDKDGFVNAASAVYVPSKKRVYLLLGNNDLKKVAPDGYTALCTDSKPSIVGIDVEKGAVVSLGGQGPSGSILLEGAGVNPGAGSLVYDAKNDRLLVLETGCNADEEGQAGAVERRRVEEVSLATGAVKTLLSLDDKGFPAALAYIDETHAVVGFYGQTFLWDPTTTSLGAEIPGGLGFFASAGSGRIVGTRSTYPDDGGAPGIELVSVTFTDATTPIAEGAVEVLATNPFTDNTAFVGGLQVWPTP